MAEHPIGQRLALAIDLARRGGAMALDAQRGALQVNEKSALDFVTDADRAVEDMMRAAVVAAFGDNFLGEEGGLSRNGQAISGQAIDAGRPLWIVDPIDGTRNYIHGNPRWCVSVGVLIDGAPTIGVIFQPVTGEIYVAQRGGGATRNGQPIRVSGARTMAHPLVEVGKAPRLAVADYIARVGHLMAHGIETRRGGAGALGLAQVAAGELDGYVEAHIQSWDVAAALVLVTEAGGVVSPFFAGKNSLLEGNAILAATPPLAPRLAELASIPLP